MADYDDDILAEGTQIIWVLEADAHQTPGTADLCMEVMDELGDPNEGWCVGDAQTEPTPGTFDDSPFSLYRGFDMIVPRSTMEILWTSSHGSPAGNDNLDGKDILQAVQDVQP
ncbi:MAG: hypothetical protein R3F59_12025 [Myxococcota bacterium]